MLAYLFGGKKLRRKKLLTGILMMSSIASLLSCGGRNGNDNTCYVVAKDSTQNNDTVMQDCYQKVIQDTVYQEDYNLDKTQQDIIPDQETEIDSNNEPPIMCYAPQVNPDFEENQDE